MKSLRSRPRRGRRYGKAAAASRSERTALWCVAGAVGFAGVIFLLAGSSDRGSTGKRPTAADVDRPAHVIEDRRPAVEPPQSGGRPRARDLARPESAAPPDASERAAGDLAATSDETTLSVETTLVDRRLSRKNLETEERGLRQVLLDARRFLMDDRADRGLAALDGFLGRNPDRTFTDQEQLEIDGLRAELRLAAAARAALEERLAAKQDALDRAASPDADETPEEPDAGTPNRLFTLELAGNLGGRTLDPNDQVTWARLGYFLQNEAAAGFNLVYPGGYAAPIIQRRTAAGRLIETPARDEGPQFTQGDPSTPTYRFVVHVEASSGGGIKFYGKQLTARYTCRVACVVEMRQGEDFVRLARVGATETTTPSQGAGGTTESELRKTYDAALEQIAGKLRALPLFRS